MRGLLLWMVRSESDGGERMEHVMCHLAKTVASSFSMVSKDALLCVTPSVGASWKRAAISSGRKLIIRHGWIAVVG